MYDYRTQRDELFTDNGQRMFLHVRDWVDTCLRKAGAVRSQEALSVASGDSWTMLACLDRMIELGEIYEVTGPDVAGQHRVFVRATRGE